MSGAFMFSAAILTAVLVWSSAHPPAWMSRARETGEQLLRARLCELLSWSAFLLAAALVGFQCVCAARKTRGPPAERDLAAARALFGAFIAVYMAWAVVTDRERWGETAAAFFVFLICERGGLLGRRLDR